METCSWNRKFSWLCVSRGYSPFNSECTNYGGTDQVGFARMSQLGHLKSIQLKRITFQKQGLRLHSPEPNQPHTLWNIIDQYSSLTQLIRITGWVMVACDRFKAKGKLHHESKLTADLISRAKLFWAKEIQQVQFHSEFTTLKNSRVPNSHVFNRLTAYIDSSGIIRVGGRLQKTQIDSHSKHLAILPRSS